MLHNAITMVVGNRKLKAAMSEEVSGRSDDQGAIARALSAVMSRPTALYALALMLLVLAAAASHALLVRSLGALDEDSVLVNMSGRQRMLSEQTYRLAGELMVPESESISEPVRTQLRSSLTLMQTSHEELTAKARASDENSTWDQDLDAVYFEGAPSLDSKLSAYFESLDDVLATSPDNLGSRQEAYSLIRSAHENGLLADLDQVVAIYEGRALARLEASRKLHLILSLAMVALLLIVTMFVVRPLIRRQNLHNVELIEARDQAHAELAERTSILAAVSHEIRTPLGGVLGIIDHLKRERSPAEREQALSLMEDSFQALLETLDAILEQARLSQASEQKEAKRFRPNAIAQRVAELFRPLARRKAIRIEVHAATSAQVLGDPGRVQQVLANFVSNAVKFTQSGVVTIRVQPPSATGQDWAFEVSDTGAGMDQNRIDTIFEAFDTSRTDSLGRSVGAGLGLSITRELVQAMEGRIKVESDIGRGSSFTVFLPLEEADDDPLVHDDQSQVGHVYAALEKATQQIQAEAIASLSGWTVLESNASLADDFNAFQPLVIICDVSRVSSVPAEMLDACLKLVLLSDADDAGLASGKHAAKVVILPTGDLANNFPGVLKETSDECA